MANRNSANECAVRDIASKAFTAYSLQAKEFELEFLSQGEKKYATWIPIFVQFHFS